MGKKIKICPVCGENSLINGKCDKHCGYNGSTKKLIQ